MARIGTVLSWTARAISGFIKNNTGGRNVVNSELFNDAGVDAPPLPGDSVVSVWPRRSGRPAAVGSVDTKNASTASPGERRTYGRDSEGTIVSVLLQQGDGAVALSNLTGMVTIAANGDISLTNGTASISITGAAVTITASGGVDINGAIIDTAGDIRDGTDVSVGDHQHLYQDTGAAVNPATTQVPIAPTP